MPNITLAVDMMGGDLGPGVVAKGLIAAAIKYPDVQFKAVGQAHVLSQYFATKPGNITVVPAQHEVSMDTNVAIASKLKETSSMGMALNMVKEKQVDACLSTGNTAGLMALSYLILKMQPGIRRPAIISSITFANHRLYITDIGANIASKGEDLFANAKIAATISNKENPRIALLNIASEEEKGTPAIKEAATLLKGSDLNYIGYIEGYDILSKKADIIICDGFVGNCITKFMEGILYMFSNLVEDPEVLPKLDHAALLAGLNGLVYKAHGNSNAKQIEQTIETILNQQQSRIEA